MSNLLARAFKEPISEIFREAVDPVALGLPTYFEVYVHSWCEKSRRGLMSRIPREDARDLSLIKSNLDKGIYSTYKQVDDDFAQMLENCKMFNGEGPVTDLANQFGKWWDAQRKKMD